MSAELGRLTETFSTFSTFEWPFSRVCPDMVTKGRGAAERAPAVPAFKWLVADVIDHVSPKLVGIRKRGWTLSALERLLRCSIADVHL